MTLDSVEKQIQLLEREMRQLESSEEYEAVMEIMDKLYDLEQERDRLSYEENAN